MRDASGKPTAGAQLAEPQRGLAAYSPARRDTLLFSRQWSLGSVQFSGGVMTVREERKVAIQ